MKEEATMISSILIATLFLSLLVQYIHIKTEQHIEFLIIGVKKTSFCMSNLVTDHPWLNCSLVSQTSSFLKVVLLYIHNYFFSSHNKHEEKLNDYVLGIGIKTFILERSWNENLKMKILAGYMIVHLCYY